MRAIVTGGASGIGAAVVSLLRERGFDVAVLDRDPCDLQVDVTDAAAVDAAVREAAERLGGLDVVVNNAGIGAAGTVADNDDEEWHRVFDINVVGMVRVSRYIILDEGVSRDNFKANIDVLVQIADAIRKEVVDGA